MPRIAPDSNDILVYTLHNGVGNYSYPNAGTAGSNGNITSYGGVQNTGMGLLNMDKTISTGFNCPYIPGSYISTNSHNGIGGGNEVIASSSVSLSGWIFLRRYTNFFAELFNKQYFVNGWSNPFLALGFQLDNSNNGSIQAYATISGTLRSIQNPSMYPVPLGRWVHLGETWDGTTLRMYINGQLVASNTFSGTIDFGSTNRGQWYLGGIPGSTTIQEAPAYVQDIRFANIARPQSYFANIYYNGFIP